MGNRKMGKWRTRKWDLAARGNTNRRHGLAEPHLQGLQQQAGAQETGKAGNEPHHGHVLTEAKPRPHGDGAAQGDEGPAAPQGGAAAQRREPPGPAHVRHNWGRE